MSTLAGLLMASYASGKKVSNAAFCKTVACAVVVRGQDSLWVVVYALHAFSAE